MNVDIGRVFGNTAKMIKERWLSLVALWAAYLGFIIVYFFVFAALIGGMGVMTTMFDPASMEASFSASGFGATFVILALLFYIGYIAILLGQYASLVAAASPLERPGFGDCFGRGLKGGLTLIAVGILLAILYLIFFLILMLVGQILQVLGPVANLLLAILLIPAGIYVACRFSMLIPSIVVEKTYNPITAINRSWEITKGKVLGIFLSLLAFGLMAAVVVVPSVYALVWIIEGTQPGDPGAVVIVLILGLLALYLGVLIAYSSMLASLHAEVSDTQAVEFSKAFE